MYSYRWISYLPIVKKSLHSSTEASLQFKASTQYSSKSIIMTLKLYFDLMSQPSRTLYILLKTVKCNFEHKKVALREAEHYGEEFTKINRLQRVPVIDHNGFILTESVAIIQYLSREGIIPKSLYPSDSEQQARVDEFLEWHHIGLRLPLAMYFRVAYMNPILEGRPPNPSQTKSYERRMVEALETFETKWLGRSTFITGDTPTVADLFAACELEQPRMAGFDPKDQFVNIAAWWSKVRDHFNPYYEEAHEILNKIVAKNVKVKSKI